MKIKSNPVKTILTISTGFLVIFIIGNYQWALYTSVLISCLGLASNFISLKIEKLWFKIAEILGLFVPNIILTVVFFFFLFPISMLSKILNKKDLLSLKIKNTSNYHTVNKNFEEKDFKNPW